MRFSMKLATVATVVIDWLLDILLISNTSR